jgi:hypothetical protein
MIKIITVASSRLSALSIAKKDGVVSTKVENVKPRLSCHHRIHLFNCIYFPIYGHAKKSLQIKHGYSKNVSVLGASFIAGGITNFISNPLWVNLLKDVGCSN